MRETPKLPQESEEPSMADNDYASTIALVEPGRKQSLRPPEAPADNKQFKFGVEDAGPRAEAEAPAEMLQVPQDQPRKQSSALTNGLGQANEVDPSERDLDVEPPQQQFFAAAAIPSPQE